MSASSKKNVPGSCSPPARGRSGSHGNGDGGHRARASFKKRGCARVKGCPSGEYIVDEQDRSPRNLPGVADPERATYVRQPLVLCELRLRPRRPTSSENSRGARPPCQIGDCLSQELTLIVPAVAPPRPMERHRDDDLRLPENVVGAHNSRLQHPERLRQRAAMTVLQQPYGPRKIALKQAVGPMPLELSAMIGADGAQPAPPSARPRPRARAETAKGSAGRRQSRQTLHADGNLVFSQPAAAEST